jgi:hypothetical protein
LTARTIERLPEVILGSHCLRGHVLQQRARSGKRAYLSGDRLGKEARRARVLGVGCPNRNLCILVGRERARSLFDRLPK